MTVPCSFRSSLARSKESLAAFTRRLPRRFESPCGVYVVCEWDCRIVVIQSSRWWQFLFQIINHVLQEQKFQRSETRDLPNRKSANTQYEVTTSFVGRTGSHPVTALNPSVPQPGLDPSSISLRPARPTPYSQGLRKPNGFLPRKSR